MPVRINDYKICAFTKNISFFSFLFIEAALLFAVMKLSNFKKDFVFIASFVLFEFVDKMMILKAWLKVYTIFKIVMMHYVFDFSFLRDYCMV